MIEKQKRKSDKSSQNPEEKKKDDKPDKYQPHPDDQNEQTGPPIKEMPIKDNPHKEEMLDRRFVRSSKIKPTNLMSITMDQYHRSLKTT